MNRKVLSSMVLFTVFLVSVAAVGSVVGMVNGSEPVIVDFTFDDIMFVKGYMKLGLKFDLGDEYYGNANVEAAFTHFRSGRVVYFNFEDTLDGRIYTFPAMKKIPSGLYKIVVHITSV